MKEESAIRTLHIMRLITSCVTIVLSISAIIISIAAMANARN